MVNKPALDTQELEERRYSFDSWSSTGLYNERQQCERWEVVAGNAPMHAKETVKLLHLRGHPKQDNMLPDD